MQLEQEAKQLTAALKSDIRTLGSEIDSYKAKTGGAMGAAVFLLLLAGGGTYDLITGNTSIRSVLGVSLAAFQAVVIALGAAGTIFLLIGIVRHLRRDRDREIRLEEMSQELARLQEP